MPAFIISALAWIFRKLSFGKLAEFVLKKVVFSKFVLIEIAMFSLMVIYFGALLAIAVFLFGQLGDIYGSIKNLTNPTSPNEVTSTGLAVLASLGVFKAFWDVFNLYAPIFISLFLMIGTGIGIKLLKKLRDSISHVVGFIK
jgi:hypothetical protein